MIYLMAKQLGIIVLSLIVISSSFSFSAFTSPFRVASAFPNALARLNSLLPPGARPAHHNARIDKFKQTVRAVDDNHAT